MISLLYCGNRNVYTGITMSLYSAAKNCTEPLDVHIVTMDWTEENEKYTGITKAQAQTAQRLITAFNSQSRMTLHDAKDLFIRYLSKSPNAASSYTPYTLLRLLVHKIEGIPDKILYLDADTLVLSDISGLYNTELSGRDYAAALDHLGKFFIGPRYQNAGVMLLNVKNIRESGLFDKAISLCRNKKYAFPDQDVINHCEKNKVFLNRRFNEQKKLRDDTVIRHFSKTIRWFPFFHTLNVKPWDEEGIRRIYKSPKYDEFIENFKTALSAAEKETRE